MGMFNMFSKNQYGNVYQGINADINIKKYICIREEQLVYKEKIDLSGGQRSQIGLMKINCIVIVVILLLILI